MFNGPDEHVKIRYIDQSLQNFDLSGDWSIPHLIQEELMADLGLTLRQAATYAFLGEVAAQEAHMQVQNEIATLEAGIYE